MKPLFLPLMGIYYDAFLDGSKTHEYRFGTRYNADKCVIGRAVLLSRGYAKAHRATGIITSFETMPTTDLHPHIQRDLAACCKTIKPKIHIIGIDVPIAHKIRVHTTELNRHKHLCAQPHPRQIDRANHHSTALQLSELTASI